MYVSTAGAIISPSLQMVKFNTDGPEGTFEACVTLNEALTLCTAIEAGHRDQDVRGIPRPKEVIIGVDVAILEFSAGVDLGNTIKRVKKIPSSFPSLKEQPLQNSNKTLRSKAKLLKD